MLRNQKNYLQNANLILKLFIPITVFLGLYPLVWKCDLRIHWSFTFASYSTHMVKSFPYVVYLIWYLLTVYFMTLVKPAQGSLAWFSLSVFALFAFCFIGEDWACVKRDFLLLFWYYSCAIDDFKLILIVKKYQNVLIGIWRCADGIVTI